MNKSMHDYVIERLEDAKGNWTAVAEGSGVPKRTLEKIARKETLDPGVSHIQKLHDYFRSLNKRSAPA